MMTQTFLGSVCSCWIGSKREMIVVKSGDKHDISCHFIRAIYTQSDVRPFWYIHYAALPFPSVISHDPCLHQMLQRGQQRWEIMSALHSAPSRNHPSPPLVFWDLGSGLHPDCIEAWILATAWLFLPPIFCHCYKNITENISNVVPSVLELLSLRLKDQ